MTNKIPYYLDKSLENLVDLIDGCIVTEIWKDIQGYEGLYMVSTFGRVKSLSRYAYKDGEKLFTVREKILNFHFDKDGYHKVALNNNSKKKFSVHRLIAAAFIENKNNYPIVLHKVERKPSYNYIGNLFWGTYKMNMQDMISKNRQNYPKGEKSWGYNRSGALSPTSKIVLDTQTGVFYDSATEAAKYTKFSRRILCKYLSGELPNKTSLIYA